ncbi:hypothetical protein Pst134EB_014016 [Puccinia striiformis f. sp. tritici]|uniref:Uncharacterized protein n=1 Tax=Puccinia striiformis f. sp. tritici PST-78 TaxID=1165861 RepID=A0A0L0VGY1_9BASI|nr:hypothetical protein Pst134EB_014016 [Puccinia striiformis f. sp. tritici]KNE98461.1 hypothetical protein PSTG_08200 [Puccinia striiformis f. sp. tritici PST-78]
MTESTVETPGAELINRKRDLIGKAFDDLETKYDGSSDWPCAASMAPLDQASWETWTVHLQSSLLPSLKNQITHLSNIMERSELLKDKGTKLDSISQIQSELDQTLYQIVSLVAVVRRRTLFSPADTNDRHLKELKGFRAQGLQSIIEDLISNMCHVFSTCFEFMGCLKLPSQTFHRHGRTFRQKDMLSLDTTRAADKIDVAIEQLKGHEFYYIRRDWEDHVLHIHRLLRQVTDAINSTNDSGDDDDSEIVNHSKLAIEVLQSIVPVIKLSRLFFKKLLRSGMKETPLQPFTEMSSHQINALANSAGSVLYKLDEIYEALTDPDVEEESSIGEIPGLINDLTSTFDTTMLLLVFYIVPLIPQVNHPSSQNPLTTWLVNWNHLFLIATRDCISATKVL